MACVRGDADHPRLMGTVKFSEHRDGTLVIAEINGLPRDSETGFLRSISTRGRTAAEKALRIRAGITIPVIRSIRATRGTCRRCYPMTGGPICRYSPDASGWRT